MRAWALSIVDGPALADKLRAPPAGRGPTTLEDGALEDGALEDGALEDGELAPLWRTRPARDASIALAHDDGAAARPPRKRRLPKMGALVDAEARVACLSRFAHHELCAVELFAWALLAFPAMPAALRRGFVQTLVEEQTHCALYLERLEAHGARFGALPLSDYFWKHVEAIRAAREPLLAFLCAMGLTLEQANLDFTLMYKDGFRAAGDEDTARVIQRVHDDEVRHVALAAGWVKKLAGEDDVDAYRDHAPFPFSLARAKGRRFDAASRKRAALSDAMIEAVRAARPYG